MRIAEVLAMAAIDRLDAEVLLAHIVNRSRAWVIAHHDHTLTAAEWYTWKQWHHRRGAHEPVAYITGEKEFYGRMFEVDRSVLIPRPSTEGLIDVALEFFRTGKEIVREVDSGIIALARGTGRLSQFSILPFRVRDSSGSSDNSQFSIVDLGTGCGCIAVTLALELPDANIVATDNSKKALAVARANAKRHKVESRIQFLFGDLLEPLRKLNHSFLIVSNPPYIREAKSLPIDVANFEPHQALFAGPDGLKVIRRLIAQAKHHPLCYGIVLECTAEQVSPIDRLLFTSVDLDAHCRTVH